MLPSELGCLRKAILTPKTKKGSQKNLCNRLKKKFAMTVKYHLAPLKKVFHTFYEVFRVKLCQKDLGLRICVHAGCQKRQTPFCPPVGSGSLYPTTFPSHWPRKLGPEISPTTFTSGFGVLCLVDSNFPPHFHLLVCCDWLIQNSTHRFSLILAVAKKTP